ncbi:protein kinase domain-containing protein [Pirellulaceae bacterium SH449]
MTADPEKAESQNEAEFDSVVELPVETAWRSIRSTLLETLQESACKNLIDRLLQNGETQQFSNLETRGNGGIPDLDRLGLKESATGEFLGTLGPYTLLRVIGTGGMSTVFEAQDERLDRRVAVKIHSGLRLDASSQTRFAREAQSQARVNHTAILPIYDVSVTATGIPYLVTELAKEGTWRDFLSTIFSSDESQHRLPHEYSRTSYTRFRLVAEVIAQIADGLSVAHAAGIVHRDIKPSNILLCELTAAKETDSIDSSECRKLGWQPRLADFGLARPLEDSVALTHSSLLSGTPAYMSPEQIIAPEQLTIATDIYSLGITLYESLSGELPFRGTTHAILQQITSEEPVRPSRFHSQIPSDLEWICMKSISHSPEARYRSAADFAADLRNWLSGRPVVARPPTLTGVFVRWCRRNPRVAILSGSVAGLMSLLTVGSITASLWILDSRSELKKRTTQAEESSRLALASATLANQQRQLTLDTLNELVGSVQEQLEKRPDTTEVRAALLSKAFEGLEKITQTWDGKVLESDTSIDRTVIDAHIKMSAIKLDQGDRIAAIKHTQQATALAEDLLRSRSEDAESWRELANALSREFELHFSAFAFDQATEIAKRLIEARSKVCELLPNDAKALRALVAAKQRLADQYRYQGKLDESLLAFRDLIVDLARIGDLSDPLDTRRDQVILYGRVGMLCSQLRQIHDAEEAFQIAMSKNRDLLEEDDANILYRNDKAFLFAKMSLLRSASGQHTEAVRLATDALNEYIQMADEDPGRVQSHTLVGTAYDLLYEVHLAEGDIESAKHAEMSSYETAMRVYDMDSDSSRHLQLASEAASRVADLCFRQGEFAQATVWAEKSYQALQAADGKADYDPQSTALPMRWRQGFWQAFQLVEQGEQECRANLDSKPLISRIALAALAYGWAKDKQTDRAVGLIQELISFESLESWDQTMLDSMILRGLAQCYPLASETNRGEIVNQVKMLAERSLIALPQLRASFQSEPDFALFRQIESLQPFFR